MYQEQFEELKLTGKLPSPSGVGLRILMLTRSEECSLDDIAATLQADPALTGRILKLANSAVTAGLQPATTVRDASVRLGLRTVCNVALGFSLISGNRKGRCPAFDYDAFWSWSLASSVAAQHLSRELKIGTPGEAFTLGLLLRIGQLALATVHPEEYGRVLTRLRGDPTLDLAHLEREAFCINHREVAAAIADDWGLPPLFAEVLLRHGLRIPEVLDWPQSGPYLRLVAAASAVADVLVGDDEASALWPAAREAMTSIGIASAECTSVYDLIGDEWKDWGRVLHVSAEFSERAQQIEIRSTVEASDVEEPSPRLRILAVDDEPTSLRIVVSLLESEDHIVTTASNGKEALASALRDPPQMVITDWMMPEMDGVELCRRLRSSDTGRDLYILILTGRDEEDRVVEAFKAGVDDYLLKQPWRPKLLKARLGPGARVIQLQEKLKDEVDKVKALNADLAVEKRRHKQASLTDALTELPNRRYAMKRLEKEWATSTRSELPLSLLLLDIDHFKRVNDTYGHDVGDEVLRSTARAVNRSLRTSDTCTRLGGEEFLVICPGTPLDGAAQLAERVRLAVETHQVQVASFQDKVTISLGVACTSTGFDSIDALLKAADEAVYEAKRQGRNQVSLAQLSRQRRTA